MYYVYELLHYIRVYRKQLDIKCCYDAYHHLIYAEIAVLPYLIHIWLHNVNDKFAIGILSAIISLIVKIHTRLLMSRMTIPPELPVITV